MVLLNTKSALAIKILNFIAYLQSEIQIFLVLVSSGNLTFFFRQHNSGFGNMTSGEMTLRQLDCNPSDIIHDSWTNLGKTKDRTQYSKFTISYLIMETFFGNHEKAKNTGKNVYKESLSDDEKIVGKGKFSSQLSKPSFSPLETNHL